MAADCLDLNEKPVLRAEASFSEQPPTTYEDWETGEEMEGVDSRKGRGTLFLTDKNRLVFVTKALWREQYNIDHHIHLRNLRNVRVDKRAFHTERLRIEYEPLDAFDASEDSSTKRTVVMYDFKNASAQEWVSKIKELYYSM